MRVLILTFGTRGDIDPIAALAERLSASGHVAVLAAPEPYRRAVSSGVRFEAMATEMDRVMRAGMAELRGPAQALTLVAQRVEPTLIVAHPKALGGLHISERLGVPFVPSLPLPFLTPTNAFPIPFRARPGRRAGPGCAASYPGSWCAGGGRNRVGCNRRSINGRHLRRQRRPARMAVPESRRRRPSRRVGHHGSRPACREAHVDLLDAGPRPLLLHSATSNALAGRVLELIARKEYAAASAALGNQIATEDGTGNAVNVLLRIESGFAARQLG